MRPLLMMIALLLVLFSAVLAWSLLLGWILTLILSFSLFEGTLLALITSGIGLFVFIQIAGALNREASEWIEPYDSPHDIPLHRFVKSSADSTWENMIRYEVANAVLYEFKRSLKPGAMNEEQLEALAIRLCDPAITILKRKTSRSGHIEVTIAQLRKELQRMDMQPYDQDILEATVDGINLALSAPPILLAIQNKMWKLPVPMAEGKAT